MIDLGKERVRVPLETDVLYIYVCKNCGVEREFTLEWIKTFTKGKILFGLRCTVCHKLFTYSQ